MRQLGGVGDLLDEIGTPVPLVSGGINGVEGALESGEGHRLSCVQQGLRHGLQQRRHRRGGVLGSAHIAPDDPADLAEVELLRERPATATCTTPTLLGSIPPPSVRRITVPRRSPRGAA